MLCVRAHAWGAMSHVFNPPQRTYQVGVFYCKMHNGEKLCTYEFPSRTRCTSVVEHQFMVQWVVGSIPCDRLIELFLVPASGPQLVEQRLWYVSSCLWDVAYKRSLAANQNVNLGNIGHFFKCPSLKLFGLFLMSIFETIGLFLMSNSDIAIEFISQKVNHSTHVFIYFSICSITLNLSPPNLTTPLKNLSHNYNTSYS